MKYSSHFTSVLLFLAVLFFPSLAAIAQQKVSLVAGPDRVRVLSPEEEQALDLFRMLARDLRKESDKLAAGRLQARIADSLWMFDEPFAREIFRWSFDAVSQPVPDDVSDAKRPAYLLRQASAVKDVLRRFGARDHKQAEEWLKTLEDEKLSKSSTSGLDKARLELLMQIALQLAPTDPEQATRLGIVSLSGASVPEGFGSLLFATANQDRRLSDQLLRAAIATLRRNQYVYDPALIAISNYLFNPAGEMHSNESLPDARLLSNYFVDAAWRQAGGPGASLPQSSASFYGLLETRATPIVARYVPDRLPELRGQLSRIASGLTQEQAQRTNLLRSVQQQQSTVSNRNNYNIDEQVERALKEKDIQVRDALLTSAAHALMRQDVERALAVAAKIDDANVRMTTEDDIYLVGIQRLLYSRSYLEARKISLKFNNSIFRAKVLAQLASKVWSDAHDGGQASEMLSEATSAALKSEDTADKVIALLDIVERFAVFDSIRAFETLSCAITTLNKLEVAKETPQSALAKPRLLTVKSYTVINGVEMTSGNNATIDSIDFSQIGSLAIHDFLRSRSVAHQIDRPLQRANFLTAVAGSVLTEKRRPSTASSNQ